ncbi:cytochrome P450 family protein [Pleurotus pulmonarius]
MGIPRDSISMNSSITTFPLLAFVFLLSAYLKRRTTKRPPLPPGPPADPLIGHLRIMPSEQEELVFHEWAKTYGDVMYFRVLGRDIIVLDSIQAATELLEKRSALYSDRPSFTVYTSLLGWEHNVAFFPYGRRFRKHRKLLQSMLTQQSVVKYRPIQLINSRHLVKGLMGNPKDFEHHISRYATSVVMRIAYGHQILSDDDEFVTILNDVTHTQNNGGTPGATMVDHFPILQYFPSWFPGTHYATFAREWRWAIDKATTVPYEKVKKQMAEGTAEPSFLRAQIEAISGSGKDLTEEDIHDLKGTAGVLFAGGADTTASSLETYILALLQHPEIQKKGQEEIDRVIGHDRLPTFEDYDVLPYVECVVQEILRWHPTAPLGIPHRAMEDDIYRGMFIPKGAIILANANGMALDENVYTEPTKFNPDRFLPKSQGGNEEPRSIASFGFGRRICPGRHLAVASMWIAVATMFATVNVNKAKDEDGVEITPDLIFETGITSRPKTFSCSITPRSEKAIRIVASECESLAG